MLAVVLTCGSASNPMEPAWADIPLYSDGVVLGADGVPRIVRVGEDRADDPAQRARQDDWIASGTVPGPPRYRDMAEQALRDLDALVLPGGAAVAGASTRWRYVWPRDASFTAVALARTGHQEDAWEVLDFLRRMQEERSTRGVLEARYLPDGTGEVPDARGPQLDGSGWVLWAVAEWYAASEPGQDREEALARLRPLVSRSVEAIRDNVDPLTGLPGVYPDYWEVHETVPTLGTLAPLLLGLRSAEPVLDRLGVRAAGLEALLARGVEEHYAPGYPRRLGGRDQDTAVAFLMPPFAPADDDVRAAWEQAAQGMARPAGGLAPGSGWKRDGISWTPTTALFALTAAADGDVELARARLDWLDAHRTARGSLPEKVLADGSPSAVAPLAWTASLVLLTLDELDRQDSGEEDSDAQDLGAQDSEAQDRRARREGPKEDAAA